MTLSFFDTLCTHCVSHFACVCCLQDHSVEIQQFCLEFSQIREATALYKLLKNLENPDAAAKAWAVVVLSCMFSFHMYLQWPPICMVMLYTLIRWLAALLWHTFSNPTPELRLAFTGRWVFWNFVDKACMPIMFYSHSKDSSTSECTPACLVRSKKGWMAKKAYLVDPCMAHLHLRRPHHHWLWHACVATDALPIIWNALSLCACYKQSRNTSILYHGV